MWDKFLSALEIAFDDDMLQQASNNKIFEMLLPSQFSSTTSCPSPVHARDMELSTDELNALQYICGYVPHALLKRYEKRTGCKYSNFID